MAKKVLELADGWHVTVEKEPTETEAGNYQAIKTESGRVVSEQHAETPEGLQHACEEYNRLTGGG